jgi:hypothetical protein
VAHQKQQHSTQHNPTNTHATRKEKKRKMSLTENKQSSIKAYGLTRYGQPSEVLHLVDVPKPQPGPRDLLVRNIAVATNPVRSPHIFFFFFFFFFSNLFDLLYRRWTSRRLPTGAVT